MKILKLSYLYTWIGDTLAIRFVDTENKDKAVVFSVEDSTGAVKTTWTSETDATTGVCDTTLAILQATFTNQGGTFLLKVTCESVTTEKYFVIDYRGYLIAHGLEGLLRGFRDVLIRDEKGISIEGNSKVVFTYKDWHTDPAPIITKNRGVNQTLFVDASPDYAGNLYIDTVAGDDILATYNFEYMTDIDFADALLFGLDKLNISPPITNYSFLTAPREYDGMLILSAYVFLLRKAIMDLEFWKGYLIPVNPVSLKATLQSQMTSAEADVNLWLKKKPRTTISPAGIAGFKIPIPYTVNQTNWRKYTVGGLINT